MLKHLWRYIVGVEGFEGTVFKGRMTVLQITNYYIIIFFTFQCIMC